MGGGQQGARADFSAWRRWNAPFVPRGELKGPDNGAARWCSLRHTLARKRVKRITLEASAGACGFSSRSRACRRARHCAKFCTGRVLPIPPSQEQIKYRCALRVLERRDNGKAALRMPASASLGTNSHLDFTPRAVKLGLLVTTLVTSALWLSSRALLSTNFLPHWYCFVGNTRLLWTTVIADLLIGLSYVAISSTLAWLVRRAGRDLPYSNFFGAFGLFIVSCGMTHFLEIVTVWKPVYWLSAAAKVITAAASVGTAIVLIVAADDIYYLDLTARQNY